MHIGLTVVIYQVATSSRSVLGNAVVKLSANMHHEDKQGNN